MDENRIAGTARNLGGRAEEALGRAVGDGGTAAEGVVIQLKGTAQDLFGQARESAADAAAAARDAGSPVERVLRTTIARQPYAAVALALGIGWLLGRSRRPI